MIYRNIVQLLKDSYKGMSPGEAFDWLLLNRNFHLYGVYENNVNKFSIGYAKQFIKAECYCINWVGIENDVFSCNIFYTQEQFDEIIKS